MTPKERAAMQQALEDICGAQLCSLNSMSSRQEMQRLMDKAESTLREALAEQADMNLNCKSVQARLATSWGYVKAEQAEQAGQDLDTCPGCGGVADNGHDREFPPNPYYCTRCTEQAEQEPMYFLLTDDHTWLSISKKTYDGLLPNYRMKCYTHPVRTKDLTDDEIYTLYSEPCSDREMVEFARAVIAADREKNK